MEKIFSKNWTWSIFFMCMYIVLVYFIANPLERSYAEPLSSLLP